MAKRVPCLLCGKSHQRDYTTERCVKRWERRMLRVPTAADPEVPVAPVPVVE